MGATLKISDLTIQNFKAIREIHLPNLGDVVVVAGPNGCGKSCILDGIRFLKSVYAGYRQQNEWHQFFGEFQLNIQNADEVRRVFHDKTKPVVITASFQLSEVEKKYVKENVRRLVRNALWTQRFGPGPLLQFTGNHPGFHEAKQKFEEAAKNFIDAILQKIDEPTQQAQMILKETIEISTEPNAVLQFVFGIYDPANIGIIDYHSANRTYHRERLGGINVNIEETSEKLAQHALYNWQNKYTNIKSELAAAYIRDLFIERSGGEETVTPSILSTMRQLFEIFLPGKHFDGPRPGQAGELTFPVKLASGGEHDIDDLSSGEKELVYGYLRLRNVSPSNSIILLDEPELHLNPRLVLGLPSFYRKHLGLELSNQLWMTTHSDAFLRDAYKNGGFTIFHMGPASTIGANDNQAVSISAEDEINQAIVDLVGDIAGFRPGNKIVVFESSATANFDASMTKRLFPEFSQRINALSGDNKFGVRQLYAALEKAVSQMKLAIDIYAIFDRDSDLELRPSLARAFSWNVYHIENYLLEESYILKVMKDNPTFSNSDMSLETIRDALKECAEDSLYSLVEHRMRALINTRLMKCLDLNYDPKISDPVEGFGKVVSRVMTSIQKVGTADLNQNSLSLMRAEIQNELHKSLSSEQWRSEFRGRDILKRFSGKYLNGLPYEAFRDSIIARMGDDGYQPPGMKAVIDQISAS